MFLQNQESAWATDAMDCMRQKLASRDAEIAELRKQLAEAQAEVLEQARIVGMGAEREIDLRQQLATFHSAVEHVTEDGCLRRSFVAMPEGWAMVHKDRLHDLELAEEQLADVRNQVLEECAAVAEDTAAG